ncbi:MAG: SusD/RagB family nutrient-binding outer membrane lipoprotein, partial [Bacteroidota bacterium]|nr:SusD/RagB family nutrient-binding outer membrane lipoprotein [Bacteroidota bacterium]
LKATIMNSDEVQFILAEAVVKGLVTGDADAYYRNGITLSMERWGIPDSKITPYLAQASITLPADDNGKLAKIADQKWLALFTVATEAYLDIRRTQLPNIFNNGLLTTYPFPLRFIYPGAELGQNVDAYNAGVATLSPAVDNQFSKMWLLQ